MYTANLLSLTYLLTLNLITVIQQIDSLRYEDWFFGFTILHICTYFLNLITSPFTQARSQNWNQVESKHSVLSSLLYWRGMSMFGVNWGRSPNRGHKASVESEPSPWSLNRVIRSLNRGCEVPENWERSSNLGQRSRLNGEGSGEGAYQAPSPEKFWKFILETMQSGV